MSLVGPNVRLSGNFRAKSCNEEPPTLATPSGDTAAARLQLTAGALERIADRIAERETASVSHVRADVAQLRSLVWVLAAVVIVLVIGMIALWVLK